MNITSYSREKIREGLRKARLDHEGPDDNIRLLIAPTIINDDNFERACNIYSRIDMENYETVVIVESHDEILDKKLPMPSNKFFETPLGIVHANDYMRNEFCDEDDDFYIHDGAFNDEMSLFHQLMLLQCCGDDFSVVSIQIADRGPAIIKELAYVLEEVLASRRALLVFCCELDNRYKMEFEKVNSLIGENNQSGLLNYLNSGESHIRGTTSFIAGIMVANIWELDMNFLNGRDETHRGSLLTAYGGRQRVLF